MPKMKIAVIRSWYLPLSETFIYQELAHLKKSDAIVCAKKAMNLEHFPFEPIYFFKKEKELKKIIAKRKIDLLHARYGTTAIELLQLKKELKLPMLTSFHGFDSPNNRKNRSRYTGILKKLFDKGEMFTVPSQHMKKILIKHGCPKSKIRVHYSGIDLKKFQWSARKSPSGSEPIRILTVGRLVEKKGTEYLLKAFKRVLKQYPHCILDIIGEGPLENQLRELAEKLNIGKKVNFLGALPHQEVCNFYDRSHLFCLPSIETKTGNVEGIPNVIKEAMATGLPIVATRHGGIPEIVKNGKTGYLVEEKEGKQLSKAIKRVIRHPEKWMEMGLAGRKVIERKFDRTKQISKLEELYRNIIKSKK